MENIYSDLIAVLNFYGVFLLAYSSNMVFSIFQNVKICHAAFDRRKLFHGILKCLMFVMGTFMLTMAIDLAAYVFCRYGMIAQQIDDMVTVVMVLGTIGTVTLKYMKEAYETFVAILMSEGL